MDLYKNERTKYDVPLNHLDFGYIEKCTNVKELENITKILRSGCEGYYPDLEKLAEQRLEALKPDSKVLRKEKPAVMKKYLDKTEKEQLDEDLKVWESQIRSLESQVVETAKQQSDENNLPPVRGSASRIPISQEAAEEEVKKQRRVKPRDYREWDKIDIEAELAKVDGEQPKKANSKNVLRTKMQLPDKIDATDLSYEEKLLKANREKDKGNEAFRAGDFGEALLYYTRSISVLPSAAAYNNRAQTYLKMKKWKDAYKDCSQVLELEPTNIKALLRRATASQEQHDYVLAKNDLVTLLCHDDKNKRAKQLLTDVEKSLSEQKVKGRRMIIEEVEGSDESSDEEKSENVANGHVINSKFDQKHGTAKSTKKTLNKKDIWTDNDLKGTYAQNANVSVAPSVEQSATGSVTVNKPPAMSETGSEQNTKKVQLEEKISERDAKPSDTRSVQVEKEASGKPKASTSSTRVLMKPVSLPEDVKCLKEKGNEFFRCGQYPEAVKIYDQCIQKLQPDRSQSSNLSVIYCNRAAALWKMGDCQASVMDCDKALEVEPSNIKALARRARAYEDMEKYREAYVDYRQILLLDSSVDVAQKGSTRCSQVLISQDGPKWREKLPVSKPILAPSINMLEDCRDPESAGSEQQTAPSTERQDKSATKKTSDKHQKSGSEKQRRRIEIQEVESSDSDDEETGSEKNVMPSIIQTEDQFVEGWNSVKPYNSMDLYTSLLNKIAPNHLHTVIGKQLDTNLLTILIKCTKNMADHGYNKKALEYLEKFTKISDFDNISKLMSEEDKRCLRQTVKMLKTSLGKDFTEEQSKAINEGYHL